MSTLLAIDFGERRLGVAWATAEGGVATPLRTLQRPSDAKVIASLEQIACEYGATLLIVGEPVELDGSRGARVERVRSFSRKLMQQLALDVVLVPEALTTVAAAERIAEMGKTPARYRPGIDAMAAALILEDYLESLTRGATCSFEKLATKAQRPQESNGKASCGGAGP